jgi:four helix bundle protein
MPTITRFEEIEAWQTARELTRLVYQLTGRGQFARDFVLSSQMQRAAVSIMSNIAEGFESRTRSLFIDFLGRAKASAGELRAQMYVAVDCGYINQQEFSQLFELGDKCIRQISHFNQYISRQPQTIREGGIEYNV